VDVPPGTLPVNANVIVSVNGFCVNAVFWLMSRGTPVRTGLTLEEFLEFEATSAVRHEFVDGFMFAMAGASDAHNLIAGNIFALLRNAARGTACRVYQNDMKLLTNGKVYYPDVLLTCDPDDVGRDLKESPCLIVEVLSDSTEVVDRGEKLERYKRIPKLQMYVLVEQNRRFLQVFRRHPNGQWLYDDLEQDGTLEFPCVSLSLSMVEIYEDVDLNP
jgi:Uma2 family endonuclease